MPRLAHAEELLDGPLDDPVVLAGTLRDLARANRWLGGVRLTRLALDQLVGREADRGAPISVLDVGTGGADIPLALLSDWHRRGRKLEVTAVEHRAEILDAARSIHPSLAEASRLTLAVADGRSLPWPDGHFDVAHCSLVLHHLDERGAVALLREMARVSRRAVIVNDLARGRLYWSAAWVLGRLATRNRYSRHDGPLSVRRAWTVGEARALLAVAGLRPHVVVRAMAGYRWAIGAAVR